MRVIKFRMWTKRTNQFFYNPDIVYDCLRLSQMTGYENLYQDMVWQQFTGFYDKNQIPIFEGDIVKDTFYQEITARIVYSLGCFWLAGNIGQHSERELYDSSQYSLEVVGNIFETKLDVPQETL